MFLASPHHKLKKIYQLNTQSSQLDYHKMEKEKWKTKDGKFIKHKFLNTPRLKKYQYNHSTGTKKKKKNRTTFGTTS